jgi:hypothetical protein
VLSGTDDSTTTCEAHVMLGLAVLDMQTDLPDDFRDFDATRRSDVRCVTLKMLVGS